MAQALVPAGSRPFSTLWSGGNLSKRRDESRRCRLRVYATSVAVRLFMCAPFTRGCAAHR